MELALIDTGEAHEILTSLYMWKYEHLTTAAKALAGAGSAIFLASLVPVFQSTATALVEWKFVIIAWVGATVLVLIGCWFFLAARKVHSEFIAAQGLLAELIQVGSFLRVFRENSQA